MDVDMDDHIDSATEIARLFREVNKSLNRKFHKAVVGQNLTPPQLMILHFLASRDKARVSDISDHFNLAVSTVSSILDRLERDNLVERIRDKRDKRVVLIVLSEKGQRLKDNFKKTVKTYMNDVTRHASEAELMEITRGLYTMRDILNRTSNEEDI